MQGLDKRFGTIAVERALISKQQLFDAIRTQVEEDLAGQEHRLIGQILMARGFMTLDQIRTVLSVMGINPDLVSR